MVASPHWPYATDHKCHGCFACGWKMLISLLIALKKPSLASCIHHRLAVL